MKVCVVGVGYWGPNLVRNFQAMKDVEKVYCFDIDKKRLATIKERFSSVHILEEYNDIFRSSIDAVAIATPVSSHYKIAKSVLENNINVLIEKPMTMTSSESMDLINLAEKKNKVLMVDHTFVYTSAVQMMKKLVDDEEIGEITYFDSVRVNLGIFQSDVNVIWDLAPHDLSILCYLCNEQPVAIQALGIDHLGDGREELAYITLLYNSNKIAHIHLSWMSPVKIRKTIVGGNKKMMVYDDMESDEKVKVYDKGITIDTKEEVNNTLVQYRVGDIYIPTLRNVEALYTEIQHFLHCIKERNKPRTSGEDGLFVVKVLEGAQKAIKSGTIINL